MGYRRGLIKPHIQKRILYIYMFIRTQMQIQMVHVKTKQWKHIETEKKKKGIEKKNRLFYHDINLRISGE